MGLRSALLVLTVAVVACQKPRHCAPDLRPVGRGEGRAQWCASADGQRREWLLLDEARKEKRQVCRFEAGVLTGAFEAWHPGGRSAVRGTYAAARKHGRWEQWDETGRKVAEGEYREGRLIAGAPVGVGAKCEAVKWE